MRRYHFLAILFLVPALAILIGGSGCSSKKAKNPGRPSGDLEDVSDDGGKSSDGAIAKTEIPSKGWGSVEGFVTYDGDPPTPASLKGRMEEHENKAECLMGKPEELIEQTWVVGPNKGVANVAIFLKAPEGKFFKVADEDKKITRPVELRQPHCAFLPHVVALYPVYYDGKEYQKTGQALDVINDAKIAHNTNIVGDPAKNEAVNPNIQPGKNATFVLNPQGQPLSIGCSFHKWMSAYAWVFDNPYHAVTKGEGEKDMADEFGKFSIARVPAGVEVSVVAWHPGAGYIWGREGKKMTFKEGEKTKLDFSIKK
jgi:hypothetical protein